MAKKLHPDSEVIDRLGGTTAVARIFGVSLPSVSAWRETGFPRARRMYVEAKWPELLPSVLTSPREEAAHE